MRTEGDGEDTALGHYAGRSCRLDGVRSGTGTVLRTGREAGNTLLRAGGIGASVGHAVQSVPG